jgi:hypothetical protein
VARLSPAVDGAVQFGLTHIEARQAPLIVFRGSGPLATALSLQQLALFRIQATLIGLLVAMGISMVWPVRAAVLLRNQSTSRTLLVPNTTPT